MEISKTNYNTLMELISKAVDIIYKSKPSNRDYNVARRLMQTKKAVVRQIEKQNVKKKDKAGNMPLP